MEVTKYMPEPVPPPQPTYDIVGLTQAQFDVIVGCVHMTEAGQDVHGDGYPAKSGGNIHNGTGIGGSLVFEAIPYTLAMEALKRLERRQPLK